MPKMFDKKLILKSFVFKSSCLINQKYINEYSQIKCAAKALDRGA